MGLFDALAAQTPEGEALRAGLLGMGAGLLSGSVGYGGAFAPALAQGFAGFAAGTQSAAENQQRQQLLAQRQQEAALRQQQMQAELAQQQQFQGFFRPGLAPGLQASVQDGAPAAGTADSLRGRIEQAMLSGNPMLVDWASKASGLLPKQEEPTALERNLRAAGLQPGTPEFRDAMLQGVRGTTVNVGVGEKAWDTESAKLFAKRYDDITAAAMNAQQMLGMYDLAEQALNSGVRTGVGAEAELTLRQLGAAMGMDTDPEKLSGGELLRAIQNRMALLMRSPDGGMGGMPGSVSDRDIKFLKDSQVGIDRSPEGNRRMLMAFRAIEQRKIEIARLADEYIAQNGRLDAGFNRVVREYANANPLFPESGGERTQQLDSILGL